ncbi:MAG: tRNA (adenosine(37)-N6)-threonylcarbamoyltransferase complex dimerization subunit type 1 TsaB [Chloroflexi bacterium]|nr:tRNA (adenosine(37)-N6)-threonylcarbamoyltransferase complex dimerization subunit type 1 TsaB [Chloroflexota bacterium]
MKVLGIDTTGYANAVGIIDGDKVLADACTEARSDSLVKIIADIDRTLKSAGLALKDIDGFGIGLGPGSWTGIRIGVTVGKMLAYSTGRPAGGVPTLEALAGGVQAGDRLICPVIPAGAADTLYAALYRHHDGRLDRQGEYYVGGLEGLSRTLKQSVLVTGPGAGRYAARLKEFLGTSFPLEHFESGPRGTVIARLAAQRLARGESDVTLSLSPLYLKESTARAFQSSGVKGLP